MSIVQPEIEIVERSEQSIRYLAHGTPSNLCRWHAHQEYELHLIIATRGKAFIGDYIGNFNTGDLYLTGPNLPHNWVTDEDFKEPVEHRDMLIQFPEHNIQSMIKSFPEFGELRDMLEESSSGLQFDGFDPLISKHYMEQVRDQTGAIRILTFLRFLTVVSRHPKRTTLSVARLKQTTMNPKQIKIGQVVDYVSHHYAEALSIAQAAEMAGMSEASFSRNFQTVTGNRFTEFVNRVRIGQACVMLFETDEQISSICYDVGFQNLANFNRHFQKMKNMTPSEFRNVARSHLT
jgi:AraC-like DNA-binding protein